MVTVAATDTIPRNIITNTTTTITIIDIRCFPLPLDRRRAPT